MSSPNFILTALDGQQKLQHTDYIIDLFIKKYCQALAQTLSPQTQKPKTKGPSAHTKIYGPPHHPTTQPITFKA